MAIDRIRREIVRYHRGRFLTFVFRITPHIDTTYPVDGVMEEIVDWILSNTERREIWIDGPQWSREINIRGDETDFRVATIHRNHPLYRYLDSDSQATNRNYLVWRGRADIDDVIDVVHFGPFGYVKEGKFKQEGERTRDLFKRILDDIGIPHNNGVVPENYNMSPAQRQNFTNSIGKTLLKIVKAIREHEKVYFDICVRFHPGDIEKQKEMFFLLLKVGVKGITILEKLILKELLIIGGKAAAKKGGTSVAKKVPLLGLGIGVGLGIYRLARGDPGRAFLEVASGATSCVPGYGTAASIGIDALIAGIDLNEANEEQKREAREISRKLRNAQNEIEEDGITMDAVNNIIGIMLFNN